MGLQDFDPAEEDEHPPGPKTTTMEFVNPDWDENPDRFDEDEKYFKAALEARHMMGLYRYQLVGEFLHAVVEMEDGNADPMKELMDKLSGSPFRNITDADEYPPREY